jgi:recombination protein RecA
MSEKPDEKRAKALELAINSIHKQFGKGTIQSLDGDVIPGIEFISTGAISLDRALGGGIPRGRVSEIYGPESAGKTTLMLSTVAECQKTGGVAAYIDAEHSLDIGYAQKLGVDIDGSKLLISQPSTGEQALETVEILVRSGAVELIVIDSVSALVPKAEIEGNMGDSHVGLQARLMSQAMRKLVAATAQTNTAIVFINQIRMKIGVMFGCFHYDARILLADGTTEKIGKIVNQRLSSNILSVSSNNKIEPKKIIDWHNNGKAHKFTQIIVEYPHKSGCCNIPIGDDHLLITPSGEKHASELDIGDLVLVKSRRYLCSDEIEAAVGIFLGDGSIKINDAQNTSRLRLKHSKEQNAYCKYKQSLFQPYYISSSGYDKQGRYWWESKSGSDLVDLSKYKYGSALRHADSELANKITLHSIAIWYLDDGNFSGSFGKWGWGKSTIYATKLDSKSKQIIADRFVALGLPRPSCTKKGFLFSGKHNKIFHQVISPYVPQCMKYKIHPKFRGDCHGITRSNKDRPEYWDDLIPAKIIGKYSKPANRKTHKFDITVEDNHCYFVDNVLVHNSPETTTGGNALKFYSSQRIELRVNMSDIIKDGDDIVGRYIKAKAVKNKVAPPFKSAFIPLICNHGFDNCLDLLALAVDLGIVSKSGSWYSYQDNKIGQGVANAARWFAENPDRFEEVREIISTL